jgi:uncharacterized protein (TIGR02391 family)
MSKMPQPKPSHLSIKDKQDAIPKIQRLIGKLNELNTDIIQERGDTKIEVIEKRIETLLADIFLPMSIEYERYNDITRLDTESISAIGNIPMDRIRKNLQYNKNRAIQILIAAAANDLYKDRHYANAVEDAIKALESYVKDKSGVSDKTGTSLMQHVFSPENPILKFNLLQSQSEKDEQRGFMFLFTGAVTGIRNPRAHEIIKDDPERALEYVAFVSLLGKLVDESKRN